MSKILCDTCAAADGLLPPSWDISSANYTGDPYQLEKFMAHTVTGQDQRDSSLADLTSEYGAALNPTI